MPQQQCWHMQVKTQVKTIIPKINDKFFHQEPHYPKYWFTKSLQLEIRSLRVFTCVLMWFNEDDSLTDSRGMNTHSTMSKTTLFWKTAFLLSDMSVFSKDRLCWLLVRSCWVNLVWASMCSIMSARPMKEKTWQPNDCGKQKMPTWPGEEGGWQL